MAPRQHEMFEKPSKPRIVRAHIIDAGDSGCCDDNGPFIARFKCGRCSWESEWLKIANVTEGKRGVPCAQCNSNDAAKRASHANMESKQ